MSTAPMNPESFGTAVEKNPPSVDLAVMPRADLPSIWTGFRQDVERLHATATTLTVTSVEQRQEMKLARSTRLALKDIRVAVEARRKELKEGFLRESQKIDGAAKELREFIEPLEARLLEQEQFAERAEAARIQKLTSERTEALRPYGAVLPAAIGEMPEEDFSRMLADAKLLHETKLEVARKAEADRVAKAKADAEERERIRKENERLRQEAAMQQEEARLEREEAAQRQREIEAKAKQEREESEAALRKEREAREASERLRQEAETAERQRKEREAAAEAKRKADEAEAARKAAAAPDREKLLAFAQQILGLNVPDLSSASNKAHNQVLELVEELAERITNIAAQL